MRLLATVFVSVLVSTVILAGVADAACRDSVGEARSTYKDVSTKVAKMKRLHQARKMISMKDMKVMDTDLKTVKSLVDEARTLCDDKRDQDSTMKAHQAIELAQDIDKRHVVLMKGDADQSAGPSGKKGDSHTMKMKH